jgi:hypothetical protein
MGRSPAFAKVPKRSCKTLGHGDRHPQIAARGRYGTHHRGLPQAIHNVPHFENKNHEIKWIWETHYHNAFPDNANAHQSEEIHHRPFPGAVQPLRESSLRAGLPDPGDLQAGATASY